MTRLLKQSTAKILRMGPFVDSTDGVTAEVGLTIAQADIQISKDGGAFAQTSAAAPTTTHDADGWYQVPLTTTDTGTLGPLTVQVLMAGALPVWEHFMVVSASVYAAIAEGTTTFGAFVGNATAAIAVDASGNASTALANVAMGGTSLILTVGGIVVNAAAAGGAINIDNSAGPGVRIDGTTAGLWCQSSAGPGINAKGTGPLGSTGMTCESENDAGIYVFSGNFHAFELWSAGSGTADLSLVNGTISDQQGNTNLVGVKVLDAATTSHATAGTVGKAVADAATQATAGAASALAVQNKLPSKTYLAGSSNADGDVQLDEATGSLPAAAVKNVFAVDMDTIEATAPADSLCAVVLAALHFSLSGNTLTIKKTDGTTFATVTVGTEATADPVVSAG